MVCPQEVTLQRSVTSDLLGLTLYYPDGDEADEETDVLVQSVEPGGIAATDGRIQPGDQIVQVGTQLTFGSDRDVVIPQYIVP